MYDTVNDVFYSNAGTGSFIAGAEVETVYYTDYLDYENQKVVRNVDDNDKGLDTPVEESVVLPAVPTDEGTVTVDVDTEIAPSYAEVVYYKNDVQKEMINMLQRTLRRMIMNEVKLIVLEASDGMVLTNGEIYSDKVYLGVNDSPENWHEIPDMGTIV